jgi:hypothetical protein
MKNATIKFLLPNAFPISKTGFYNEIQAPSWAVPQACVRWAAVSPEKLFRQCTRRRRRLRGQRLAETVNVRSNGRASSVNDGQSVRPMICRHVRAEADLVRYGVARAIAC